MADLLSLLSLATRKCENSSPLKPNQCAVFEEFQPHLSTFLRSDVFLQGHNIGDRFDGHQVDTWRKKLLPSSTQDKVTVNKDHLVKNRVSTLFAVIH